MSTKAVKREFVALQPMLVDDRFVSPHLRVAQGDPILLRRAELFVAAPPRSGWLTAILGYTSRLGDVYRGDRLRADDPRVAGHEEAFLDVGDERLSDAQLAGLAGMLRHNSRSAVEQRARQKAERQERERVARQRRAKAVEAEATELESRAAKLRAEVA